MLGHCEDIEGGLGLGSEGVGCPGVGRCQLREPRVSAGNCAVQTGRLVSFISLLIPVKRNGELCGQSGLGIHRQPAPAWLSDLLLAVLWKTFMAPFHVDPA